MVVKCDACGAEIDGDAHICHACGASRIRVEDDAVHGNNETELARGEGRTDQPLPKLPDSGLAAAMPDWLRPNPELKNAASDASPARPSTEAPDFATLVSEDDFPDWLRRFAERETGRTALGTESAPPEPVDVPVDSSHLVHDELADSGHPGSAPRIDKHQNGVGTIPAPDRRRLGFAVLAMVLAIAVVLIVVALTL